VPADVRAVIPKHERIELAKSLLLENTKRFLPKASCSKRDVPKATMRHWKLVRAVGAMERHALFRFPLDLTLMMVAGVLDFVSRRRLRNGARLVSPSTSRPSNCDTRDEVDDRATSQNVPTLCRQSDVAWELQLPLATRGSLGLARGSNPVFVRRADALRGVDDRPIDCAPTIPALQTFLLDYWYSASATNIDLDVFLLFCVGEPAIIEGEVSI